MKSSSRGSHKSSSASLLGVDLAEALRLLHQSGYPDPLAQGLKGKALIQHVLAVLCELSLQDGLTGIANARSFRATLDRELDRAGRTQEPLTLILADLDHFKTINDTYGHPAGDQVLRVIARRLKDNLRPMDTIARYGGEEFALILPNSSVTSLGRVAERLRLCVAQEPVILPDGTKLHVTASFGVASSQPWAMLSASALIDCADRHLYLAKTRGRNQVSCESQTVPAVSPDERTALFQRSRAS